MTQQAPFSSNCQVLTYSIHYLGMWLICTVSG